MTTISVDLACFGISPDQLANVASEFFGACSFHPALAGRVSVTFSGDGSAERADEFCRAMESYRLPHAA